MSYRSEARTNRYRRELDRDDSDRVRAGTTNAGTITKLVWTVTETSYPTAANRTFAVREIRSTGQESEGYATTQTEISPIFYAQILGTKPPLNTYLLVTLQEGRWCGQFG